ncbi:hypothetical protein L21SP2_0485 [Salinispira pacifica]|uniref:Uncharacterized protein n=1 Tax=Salinispira pacifica TaxID=1307761 RepID=V5WDQ4_9SPIO|nr:hypothetical protein L21SP2_0485 [Salinispira pacifica]
MLNTPIGIFTAADSAIASMCPNISTLLVRKKFKDTPHTITSTKIPGTGNI